MGLRQTPNHCSIVELLKRDVAMQQVVAHPHSQHQANIAQAIYRYDFHAVLNGQVALTIKRYQQKGAYTKYFPPYEQCFKIAGEYECIVCEEEKNDGIKEPFEPTFPMNEIFAVNGYQDG